jgi:hypothetical protein
MTELTFKTPYNIAKLANELVSIPGVVVTGEGGVRQSLISVVNNDTDGTITIYADDSLDQSVLDALSYAVQRHDPTPDPVPDMPDFGNDVPDNFAFQIADGVTQARAYLNASAPTQAQTVGVVKLIIRLLLYMIKQQQVRQQQQQQIGLGL